MLITSLNKSGFTLEKYSTWLYSLGQQGTTADMIHKIVPLIAYMSKFFTLKAGDVVLTGTPEGVGPLASGDELVVNFNGHSLTTRVL